MKRFKVFGRPRFNSVLIIGVFISAEGPADAEAEFFRQHPEGVVQEVIEIFNILK